MGNREHVHIHTFYFEIWCSHTHGRTVVRIPSRCVVCLNVRWDWRQPYSIHNSSYTNKEFPEYVHRTQTFHANCQSFVLCDRCLCDSVCRSLPALLEPNSTATQNNIEREVERQRERERENSYEKNWRAVAVCQQHTNDGSLIGHQIPNSFEVGRLEKKPTAAI